MESVKIVHCSDTHFDSPYSGLSLSAARIRSEEQRETFNRIIDKTIEYGADVLLLAGDLFDCEFVSYRTVEFLKSCFSRLKNTRVFIAPGNHDYISHDSIYNNVDFGENVHIFRKKIEYVQFDNVRVYGYGFAERFVREPVLRGFSAEDGYINIMVLHGVVASDSDYNPVLVHDMEKSNLDYLALGHQHSFSDFQKAGKTTYAYCGIPEGRHFDEAGPKGIILGEVSRGGINLAFCPMSKRIIEVVDIDVTDCKTYDDVLKQIKPVRDGIAKITLTGTPDINVYFDPAVLEEKLGESMFFAKVVDSTKQRKESSPGALQSLFSTKLLNRTEDSGILELAEKFGISALRGERIV